jgi:hypothetical protein
MQNSVSFILQVATVALIVVVTRWLLTVKGDQPPKPVRALAYMEQNGSGEYSGS